MIKYICIIVIIIILLSLYVLLYIYIYIYIYTYNGYFAQQVGVLPRIGPVHLLVILLYITPHSAKGGSVETGCSDLNGVVYYCTV